LKTFLKQLLGTIDLSIYLAWFLLAFIAGFAILLIRVKPITNKATTPLFIGIGPSYFGTTILI
jgi:hypothetical protein